MTIRKHELMYQLFGKADQSKCKDCNHYISYKHHDYTRRKCEIYGVTCSEATDWKASGQACGLFPDKETDIRDVVRLVKGGRQKEQIEIEGQISLFD